MKNCYWQFQILEKIHENQVDSQNIFVVYKAVFDTPLKNQVFVAITVLGIPAKLARSCRIMLNNTSSSFKIGKDLFEPINTVPDFRQGDPFYDLLK